MKHYFNANNHAIACFMAPVNGFTSANSTNTATHIAKASYSVCCDSPGASYFYSSSIIAVPYCILAASCIFTLLGAIFFNRLNKPNKDLTK